MTNRWYAVHAYSNFENKVADSIREQAKQRGRRRAEVLPGLCPGEDANDG
jgi:transcription antitermination factor NusG